MTEEIRPFLDTLLLPDKTASDDVHAQFQHVAPAYNQLVRVIESADHARRIELEKRLGVAVETAGAATLGSYFMYAAWVRCMVGNPGRWQDMGADSLAPSAELMANLDAAIARCDQDNPYSSLVKGVRAFITGDDAAAYAEFYRARENPLYWFAVRDDLKGSSTCRRFPALHEVVDRPLPLEIGRIEWHTRPPLASEPYVISYFCDDVYFRAFAPHVIASLPDPATGVNLHFHVINLSENGKAIVPAMADVAKSKGAALQISCEETPVRDRAYFASARFIRLADFLDHFGRAILLIDIDSEFVSDPRAWCGGFVQDFVNMLFVRAPWGNAFVPWRAVWAGMIYAPSTDFGYRFARLLRSVIGYLWDVEREANWWIDQNALYMTYRLLQRHWGPLGFADIPAARYRQIRTGEDLKLKRLKEVGQVGEMIAGGRHWVAALREIQLAKKAN